MITVGSYNNLSVETLNRIRPYVEQLKGREITPEQCPVTPLTDEQVLLRGINRIVSREITNVPASFFAGTFKQGCPSTETSPITTPMSNSQIEAFRREMAEAHARSMSMLSSIFRQLEVLKTNGAE